MENQYPRYSPALGGMWLQMTGALRPIQTNKNSHMEVSIHVGVIVVRTQYFVLNLFLFPLIFVYINYNYQQSTVFLMI